MYQFHTMRLLASSGLFTCILMNNLACLHCACKQLTLVGIRLRLTLYIYALKNIIL